MLAVVCCDAAIAQEATLSFATGLDYSSDDGTTAQARVGLNVLTETRVQRLEFDADGTLEQETGQGSGLDIEDPIVRLTYGIESLQTSLETTVSFRQSDVDDFTFDDLGDPGEQDFDTTGQRENINARVNLAFGRESRFGGLVNLGYSDTNFTNISTSNLVDSRTATGGLSLRFDIDPLITTTVSYNRTDTTRDNDRDALDEQLRLGAQFEISPVLSADVTVGYSRVTVDDTGTDSVTDGLSYSIGLVQAAPSATLTFDLSSSISETGRRTSAIVGASYTTRRGELSGSFGLSDGEDSSIRPLFSLQYDEELARGSFGIGFDQEFGVTTDGDEILNSRLDINWRRDLNRSASIGSSLAFQNTDTIGQDDDTSLIELGISFSQELTQTWALTTSYTHSRIEEDGEGSDTEDEIFIGLETTLGWRL